MQNAELKLTECDKEYIHRLISVMKKIGAIKKIGVIELSV